MPGGTCSASSLGAGDRAGLRRLTDLSAPAIWIGGHAVLDLIQQFADCDRVAADESARLLGRKQGYFDITCNFANKADDALPRVRASTT